MAREVVLRSNVPDANCMRASLSGCLRRVVIAVTYNFDLCEASI